MIKHSGRQVITSIGNACPSAHTHTHTHKRLKEVQFSPPIHGS